MALERFPRTATISWAIAPTYNSIGDYIPGTSTNFSWSCSIQRSENERLVIASGGEAVTYKFDLIGPLTSTDVPENATITFLGADHKLIEVFDSQLTRHIKCQD